MSFPNPFIWLAALLPLIGYLLTLSIVRVSGRALVTTGGRDLAAVMLAVAGLVVVGPVELFFPHATATLLGVWVWLPLAILYGLIVLFAAISSRSRIVVYGRDPDEIYPAMLRAAQSLDADATGNPQTWQVRLPTHDIDLRIDATRGYDCCSIESFQPMLATVFWSRFLGAMRTEIVQTRPRRRRGFAMLATALLLLGFVSRLAIADPTLLADGFRQWLFR